MPSFKDLELSAAMQANLAQLGFSKPTDIQARALPHCLAGRDVIAMAQTGSGKTAAFGIGSSKASNRSYLRFRDW